MRPPTPKLSSKKRYPSLVIFIGLFSGILITALVWLKFPNQWIGPLSWLSFSLIGLVGFLYVQKPFSSTPRWVIILAILAAVSLVNLFPELFGPACGGVPRAFASPSTRCGTCLDYVCEWNYKKHQEWCYCDEWDTTGCTLSNPPAIQAVTNCSQWGSDGWCVGSSSLNLSATDPQGLDVMISGELDAENFACPASPGTSTCIVPLPQGSGIANYTATSTSELTASGTSSFKRDSVQPQINGSLNGTNGSNGWFLSAVNVTASASDPQPGSGLAAFTYNLNGAGWITYSAPFTLPDGIHTLSLRARDAAGNITNTNQTVKVDTITPTLDISLMGAAGTSGWYRSTVQVNAAASDSGSGVSAFEYDLDGASWTAYTAPLDLSDGNHSLNMRVTDAAGNLITWGQTFQVDTITPVLDLTVEGTLGTSGWYTSLAKINLTASDPGSPFPGASGLNTLEYNLDGSGWVVYSTPLELADGVYNLEVRATDAAGNITHGSQSFKVDTAGPLLDVNVSGAPGLSSWYTSIVQVEAVADDSTSSLSTLEVKVNGGDWSAYNAPLAFGDGPHSYRFRASDNAGNQVLTPLQTLQVDTIPPAINLPLLWELGEKAPFALQDNGSGLASVRLVIEDAEERYPKVTWEDLLESYTFEGEIDWDARFNDGSLAPAGGEYYAVLKVTDKAGNESQKMGQIEIPLPNFVDTLIQSSTNLVSGMKEAGPIVTLIPGAGVEEEIDVQSPGGSAPSTLTFGGGNNDAGTASEQSALNLGGSNNGAAQPTGAQTGMTSFDAGGQSTASPLSNASSNLLWGATAAAAVGAFVAEITRKKEEEEAKAIEREKAKAAEVAARQERRENSNYHQEIKANKQAKLEAEWALERAIEQAEENQRERLFDLYNQTRKEEMLEVVIPPKKPFPPANVASWKERDYAQTEHSKELAAVVTSQLAANTLENNQEQKSWWDKSLDWIDNNQVVLSIGIGLAIGLGAAAIILTGGAAVPVILGAVALAGIVTGGGTIALNTHYGRDWNENLLRNTLITVGTTVLTAGITVIGAKVIGAGVTFCSLNPVCSSLIDPAMKAVDFIEEASLVVKAGVQTYLGDSIGTGETLLELEMERIDGGIPGNAIAKEIGGEALEALSKHGDEAIYLLREYGEDVIPLILKHGNDAIDIIGTYGDEGITLLHLYGDKAVNIVKEYGTPAVNLLKTLDIETADKLLKNLDEDVVKYALDQGSDAVTALSHWPEDFLRIYGDELALRAKQDARALEAASRLVKLKDLNTQEAKELLDTIAYNSIQNSGNRLVLGKWVAGTLDEGFMGVARVDGALFYGTNPGIEEIFAEANSIDAEDLYWAVNNRVLEIATEQNLKIDYSLSGLPPEGIPIEISAIKAIQSGMTSGEVAEKFFKGNFPFRMKEVEVLIANGYTFTVDEVNNIINWSKP